MGYQVIQFYLVVVNATAAVMNTTAASINTTAVFMNTTAATSTGISSSLLENQTVEFTSLNLRR